MTEKYGIRSDYRENDKNITREVGDVVYWGWRRRRLAGLYQWHVYQWARSLIKENGYRSVLDVGCGPATKLDRYIVPIAQRVVGIDQPSVVEWCKKKYSKGEYLADDFVAPKACLNEKFDLIISSDVIEHLDNPDYLLSYIRRHCHENTLILISTPERCRLRGEDCLVCPNPAHMREWSEGEFRRYIESRGFTIVDMKILPPMRLWPSLVVLRHLIRQIRHGRPWRYNMAVLVKPKYVME